MGGQLRIGAAVLQDAEEFLTDRGAVGLEGTGLVAFGPDGDGWRAEMFVAPEQRGQRAELGCWVEVTERGKRELAARLPAGFRYLARSTAIPRRRSTPRPMTRTRRSATRVPSRSWCRTSGSGCAAAWPPAPCTGSRPGGGVRCPPGLTGTGG